MSEDRVGNIKDSAEQELFEFLNNSTPATDTRRSSTGSSRSRRTPESQSADSAQPDDVAGIKL